MTKINHGDMSFFYVLHIIGGVGVSRPTTAYTINCPYPMNCLYQMPLYMVSFKFHDLYSGYPYIYKVNIVHTLDSSYKISIQSM
jgi:hypothetical protein